MTTELKEKIQKLNSLSKDLVDISNKVVALNREARNMFFSEKPVLTREEKHIMLSIADNMDDVRDELG